MLGSYVSAAYESTPTPAVERFYSGLLAWAGVVAPLNATGNGIEARLLETPTGPLVFVFNHNAQPAATTLTLPPGAATDLMTGTKRRVVAQDFGGQRSVGAEGDAVNWSAPHRAAQGEYD